MENRNRSALTDIMHNLSPSTRLGHPDRHPPGYEKYQTYLKRIIKSVVDGNKEGKKLSNSVIVYGPPECGKTSFVESSLAQLKQEHKSFCKRRKIIRLNGKICTTFKSAIEEICFQMSFDDILAKCEENEQDMADHNLITGNTFDDRLEQTLQMLKTNLADLKLSVIFILDSLELFAEQPNQSLLYNLFDLATNNSSVPVCIIGVTCRVDVLELFEKRVKSRFSHRQINLVGGFQDFEAYHVCSFDLLTHWKDQLWNEHLRKLYHSSAITKILRYIYDSDKSMGKMVVYLYTVLLATESNYLQESDFQFVFDEMFSLSSKVRMALDLSTSELIVLVSIYKQIQNNTKQAWQPQILYKDVEKTALNFAMKKEDFMQAVRKIHSLELITAAVSSRGNASACLNMETYFKCELTYHEFKDIWAKYPNMPSSFQEYL